MSSMKRPADGKAYWRSLDELAGSPEFERFVREEFPGLAEGIVDPTSRRRFLKFMGASMALAGMTACRWPREEILPFASRPEGYVPGNPLRYATAMELEGVASGLLVTSYDGRPIKIEGNPEHPFSMGATSAVAQAAVLELYDPDRSGRVMRGKGDETAVGSWDEFDSFLRDVLAGLEDSGGAGLAVLSESSESPSVARLRERLLQRFPQASWHQHEAVSRVNERTGAELAFGRALRPHFALDRARVIVSFDEDLLLDHPAAVRHARDFAEGRRADDGRMNRLHVVETGYSITGASADHRYPVAPSRIPAAIGHLAAKLFLERGLPLPAGAESLADALRPFVDHAVGAELAGTMADDLLAHRGESVVVVGPRQPGGAHAIAHALNAALGNTGRTVRYTGGAGGSRGVGSLESLKERIGQGTVSTLIILGGNPVFDGGLDLAGVTHAVHLSLHRNETSRACEWHLPRAHFLEAWGDARGWDGTVSVVQPLIEPLFDGRSSIELLARMTGEPSPQGYDIVRSTLGGLVGGVDFESKWRRILHDGLLADSARREESPRLAGAGWADAVATLRPAGGSAGNLELAFLPDPALRDGRFANNGWLQELPESLSKLTWDNALMVSPATAQGLGLGHGDVAAVRADGAAAELPVFLMPGVAAGSATVWLGYGRTSAGRVGDGVGVDVYPLRGSGAFATVSVEPTGRRYELATTQNHWAIDRLGGEETRERSKVLARELEFREFLTDPHAVQHMGVEHPAEAGLWKEFDYEGHRWGMAIDLSACTGCNACIVACQAENNIPVVGKEETGYGRAMHWIRVDRYFQGEPDSPAVAMQPVTCHHCENAPCEQVCPVAATVHDSEGLNVMVYNRCVGTRYCSNNCPYKVRRFNWFNNRKHDTTIHKMVYNPEVTVRSRGVMEKCTFCVQRISAVKIQAKNEGRPVADGEITTACEQACPTRAITFGDLNDPDSRVRRLFGHPRAYAMLEELDVKPRTRYLARLRNRSGDEDPHSEETAHS